MQSGWLRASERKLDRKKSTLLEPVLSLRKRDAAPLPEGPLRQGHDPALLRGPRLPQGLADPGDDRRAGRRPAGLGVRRGRAHQARPTVAVAHSPKMPSRLLLPVVPGVEAPTGAAALPGPARRAVPRLRAVHEPRALAALSLAIRHRRRLTAHRHPERGLLTRRAAPPASGRPAPPRRPSGRGCGRRRPGSRGCPARSRQAATAPGPAL